MSELPTDPFILISTINTLLRNESGEPAEICAARGWSWEEICIRLKVCNFEYSPELRRFW